jgi:membrane protein
MDSPTDVPAPGWRSILRRTVREFRRDNVTDLAAALTYYGILAIFPGLLVLVSLLGLAGPSTVNKVLDNLGHLAPGGVNSFLHAVLAQVQGRSSAGVAAILGLLVALWSASGYIAAFMRASNTIYDVGEGRPITRTLPIRLGVTVVVAILLVITALIVVVTGPIASTVGHALGIGDTAVTIWNIAKWPVLFVLVSLIFSLLYWACPNVKQPGFRWITPGGLLAVLIWVIASALFGVYLSFSNSYNRTYGAFAAVIIFLVWLWISNIAVLLGAEFNAETERQRAVEAGAPDDLEPFVELRDTRKLDEDEKRRVEAAEQQLRRATRQHDGAADK